MKLLVFHFIVYAYTINHNMVFVFKSIKHITNSPINRAINYSNSANALY